MNFISALEETAAKDLRELENCVEQAIKDDEFIREACLPLFNGGKRLRPMLFLLCAKSRGNVDQEKIMPLATALELIHTASLVHDDILDKAQLRRGRITTNSKYGSQIAVLVGDYLFAKAFQLVTENNYGDEVGVVLSRLVKNLCIGEIKQDTSLFQIPSMTEYYERIHLKTAVFLSCCCRLGAMAAGMDRREEEALAAYGSGLGLAFQIVDDLLDFFGDEQVTGKALGGDLKSGVITLPVIRALKVSKEESVLREIVTRGEVTQEDISDAIEIIKNTDALMYCKMRADGHIDAARVNLPFIMKTPVKLALEQIADFVVDRTW